MRNGLQTGQATATRRTELARTDLQRPIVKPQGLLGGDRFDQYAEWGDLLHRPDRKDATRSDRHAGERHKLGGTELRPNRSPKHRRHPLGSLPRLTASPLGNANKRRGSWRSRARELTSTTDRGSSTGAAGGVFASARLHHAQANKKMSPTDFAIDHMRKGRPQHRGIGSRKGSRQSRLALVPMPGGRRWRCFLCFTGPRTKPTSHRGFYSRRLPMLTTSVRLSTLHSQDNS